jgi:predicted HAD superfamily Cof-like phosphohydrolase
MSKDWVDDIYKMHKHYGVHKVVETFDDDMLAKLLEFRYKFLEEEMTELLEADTADEAVDALIDLCVVAIGTLDAMDVDIEMAWDKVLKANMSKKVGVKQSRPNPLGLPDLIKPEGWEAPSHNNNVGLFGRVYKE